MWKQLKEIRRQFLPTQEEQIKVHMATLLERIRKNPAPKVPYHVSWKWENVKRILAYKEDHFTFDVICIRFELDQEIIVIVTEEEPGFVDLMQQMERALPIAPVDWYSSIMIPTFEECLMLLFARQNG